MPEGERHSLKHIVIDSYEAGSQNWSPVIEKYFIERFGYDPKPWMPIFTGRVVVSQELSDGFLWDYIRLEVEDPPADEMVLNSVPDPDEVRGNWNWGTGDGDGGVIGLGSNGWTVTIPLGGFLGSGSLLEPPT